MTKMTIPNMTWIVVGDGRKALFFVNEGDEAHPDFKTIRLLEQENPPTREQGTDKPGRYNSGPDVSRSAVDNTDWHQLEEDRFAHDIAEVLYKEAHKGSFDRLVLIAPPKVLGELRKTMHQEVTSRIIGEIDKTYTNHPVSEIEKLITAE